MARPRSRLKPIVIAALAAFGVASVGGTLTDLGPWYQSLEQPSWNPPDYVFPIVWTIIFALSAAAGVTAWRRAPSAESRYAVIGLFAFNAALNIIWSLLFFQLKRPDLALIEVGLLWLSILGLMILIRRLSTTAALLLVPYLIWVSIAAALNYEVVRLNGPF